MYKEVNIFALRLLKQKQYSATELKAKLLRKFPHLLQDVDKILNYFVEIDLVNDQRLAESIALSYSSRGYGPLKIKEKLIFRKLKPTFNYSPELKDLAIKSLQQKALRHFPILTSPGTLDLEAKFRINNWIKRRGFIGSFMDLVSTWGENENQQSN